VTEDVRVREGVTEDVRVREAVRDDDGANV